MVDTYAVAGGPLAVDEVDPTVVKSQVGKNCRRELNKKETARRRVVLFSITDAILFFKIVKIFPVEEFGEGDARSFAEAFDGDDLGTLGSPFN